MSLRDVRISASPCNAGACVSRRVVMRACDVSDSEIIIRQLREQASGDASVRCLGFGNNNTAVELGTRKDSH